MQFIAHSETSHGATDHITIRQRYAPQSSERRVDLDWVRIAAFGLLIFYHVGMLYVSWGFHIKSVHRITALEPLMLVLNPWRLALLFLVSGAATRFMLRKYTVGLLLRARSSRLLIPLRVRHAGDRAAAGLRPDRREPRLSGRFRRFLCCAIISRSALQFCNPGPCIVLPTWNHLWFVAYLWVYTMALGAALVGSPRACRLGRTTTRRTLLSGPLLLILPSIAFAAYRLVLLPRFPSTHAPCSATGTITRCLRRSS